MAESLLSISILTSWFTPTSLFLFLNLVIGTIVVISRLNSGDRAPQHEEVRQPLARAPSLIDRVKSINLSFYRFSPHDSPQVFETADATPYHFAQNTATTEPEYHVTGGDHHSQPQLERAPSLLERVKSIKFPSFYRSEPEDSEAPAESDADDVSALEVEHEHHHVRRSKSESKVGPVKAKEKMKKSASERTMDKEKADQEEDRESVEDRRPATTRLKKTVSFVGEEDGVDAKADDFINKFKQQLKLQRLDSLLRCRDMLKGK